MKKKISVLLILFLGSLCFVFAEGVNGSRWLDTTNNYGIRRFQIDSKDVDAFEIVIRKHNLKTKQTDSFGCYTVYYSKFSDEDIIQIVKQFNLQATAYDTWEMLNSGLIDFVNIGADLSVLINKTAIKKYGYLYASQLDDFELIDFSIGEEGERMYYYLISFP